MYRFEQTWKTGPTNRRPVPPGAAWSHLEPFGATWSLPEPPGAVWSRPEIFCLYRFKKADGHKNDARCLAEITVIRKTVKIKSFLTRPAGYNSTTRTETCHFKCWQTKTQKDWLYLLKFALYTEVSASDSWSGGFGFGLNHITLSVCLSVYPLSFSFSLCLPHSLSLCVSIYLSLSASLYACLFFVVYL